MNKRLWIIPIALILLTAVFVGYLGSRDVMPDSMVCKTNPDDCVTVTESDALYLLDHQRALFDRCFDAFSAGESYTLPDGVLYAVEAPDALSLGVESAPGEMSARRYNPHSKTSRRSAHGIPAQDCSPRRPGFLPRAEAAHRARWPQ